MDYYLEVWLRDLPNEIFKDIRIKNTENYHPHITLARPFSIWNLREFSEDDLRNLVSGFCTGKKPVKFAIEGKGRFESRDGTYYYFPVVDVDNLLRFNDELENKLEEHVQFAEKLDNKKNLHMTLDTNSDILPCPKTVLYMDRLTAMRNLGPGKDVIWFSYDFIRQRELSREESKNRDLWRETLNDFYAKKIIP